MITLKQLVEEQKYTGESDMSVIQSFFDLNDMEEEGMDLIHELTKIKVEKLKRIQRIVREWVSHLPSEYLYEHYDLGIASKLHDLELDYLSHGCELSSQRLEWAKENIPDIEIPKVYFQPLIEYLDEKGIRFKGEEPIKKKSFTNWV